LIILPVEPTALGLPFARTLLAVRASRTIKKTGRTSTEIRYYTSCLAPDDHPPERWEALIRGHWAGVEVRNHWLKDAVLQEDKTRSRNPTIVGALILLRAALLRLWFNEADGRPLPAVVEAIRRNPRLAFRLVTAHS
jgi:predicted transposase YbfD/YdcC